MDIIERVHEEMGVDLITQILQLLLQILPFQFCQPLLVVTTTEIILRAEVCAKHQNEHHQGQYITFANDGRRHMVPTHTMLRFVVRRLVERGLMLAVLIHMGRP